MFKLLLPIITIGLLGALGSYSFGKYVSHEWHPLAASSPHADTGNTYRTPPDCGLDWLCLKTWFEGKPPTQATEQDLAALIERSVADAKRHRILSGSDEQAALRVLWGDGQ